MPTEQVAEALQQLDSDEAVYLHRGPRQGRAVRHPRQAPVLRARGARAEPRISRGLGRPHHADRSHRRAAVLVGRADDRLHARGRGSARPLLRSVRRRSRLSPDRLGGAQSAASLQASGRRSRPSPTATSIRSPWRPTRRRWRASSSATISPRRRWSTPISRLVGVITADDVVEVVQEEASEDILRMGGVAGESVSRLGLADHPASLHLAVRQSRHGDPRLVR